jgi:medium-chain acyl-[acyl-carrier-protein] hydrolase
VLVEVKEEKFRVRTYECGVEGRIKIFSLMQYLQEIAALHAEQLGLGFDKLSEMGGYWVLSNIRIEINRLPGREDQLTLKTWPSRYSRTIATREFVGTDKNGAKLFRAGSEWMVLNKETNRLKNLFKLDLNLPKTGTKALSYELKRLEPNGDYREVDVVRVPRSAIDLNGHVNNTEYVRWGMDVLSRTFKIEKNIRSVQATYLSEVFEGDELDLLAASRASGLFGVLGRKSGSETNVFLMELFSMGKQVAHPTI